MTYSPDTLVWWQPAKATRPRPARIVRAAERGRWVVQVLDEKGADHPLWWPKEAEAGDLRPVVKEAA